MKTKPPGLLTAGPPLASLEVANCSQFACHSTSCAVC